MDRTSENFEFYLRALAASMMLRMVSHAWYSHGALLRFEFFRKVSQISDKIPYIGRGRKMLYENALKNRNITRTSKN